jgi:hypothetical protein
MVNMPSGWSIEPTSKLDATAQTLTLDLFGNVALTDGVNMLGEIGFDVRLPKDDAIREVKLVSATLLTDGHLPVDKCLSNELKSGTFELIYECGDSTIQAVMNTGKIAAITHLSPNPTEVGRKRAITIGFAMRHEGEVTIEIFDMLGTRVGTVLDHVPHKAGIYNVQAATRLLPSGSYFCRLQVGDVTHSAKLIIRE